MPENQVKELRLQDKLGKQNFHVNIRKLFEPVTDTNKNTSEDFSKTLMLTSKENNKALSNLNNKVLETMNHSDIIESYLFSPLSKVKNREDTCQFELVQPGSNTVNDLLIIKHYQLLFITIY